MPTCQTCGAHVSSQFAKVFGDVDDLIHACPSCGGKAGLADVNRERSRRRNE